MNPRRLKMCSIKNLLKKRNSSFFVLHNFLTGKSYCSHHGRTRSCGVPFPLHCVKVF